ncbi:MAG TPA: hypothetical protein DD434_09735 [Bacteroidales bacterium]|nr:hypothetical protein [Bacteroidales bacterium]
MKKILLLLALAISLSAIAQEELQTIKVDNLYSIVIPTFLTPNKEYQDQGIFYYEDVKRHYYISIKVETKQFFQTVIDTNFVPEKVTNNLDGYVYMLDKYYMNNKDCYGFEYKDTLVNGMKAIYTAKNMRVNGDDIKHISLFIEGKDTYYEIMSFTFKENYESNKDLMHKSMFTFKEL